MGQNASDSDKVEAKEIDNLLGNWEGSLTYIDYNSNEPYKMPCNLEIKSKKQNRKLVFKYEYPNEPKANGVGKLKISKDGKILDGRRIVSRKKRNNEEVELITEHRGKDGNENRSARIRNVYIIGKNTFIMKKEVKFDGTEKWLKRNEYSFVKKN